jgi:hypothetical protein
LSELSSSSKEDMSGQEDLDERKAAKLIIIADILAGVSDAAQAAHEREIEDEAAAEAAAQTISVLTRTLNAGYLRLAEQEAQLLHLQTRCRGCGGIKIIKGSL